MKKAVLIIALICVGYISFGQKKQRKFTKQFYFEWASHELDSIELAKAKKFNKILDKFNLTKIEVIGHTDSDGSNKFNLELSRKRIRTVTQILSNSSRDSLFTQTPKGEKEPIAANTDSTKHKNRRVTVIAYYSGKKGTKSKKIKKIKIKQSDIAPSNQKRLKKEDLISGNTINLPSVNFEGGTAVFLPGAEEVLGKVVELLKQNPKVKVEVAGHICCGNDMLLSIARAKKVYTFLHINGIDKDRLTYKGYNNTQPKFGNIMDIRNRRVELKVL
mgnify:CR=1 FL=1